MCLPPFSFFKSIPVISKNSADLNKTHEEMYAIVPVITGIINFKNLENCNFTK